MSSKQIKFDTQAQAGLMRGVEILTNAVRSTLGPRGRNVLIEKTFGAPNCTKDGGHRRQGS